MIKYLLMLQFLGFYSYAEVECPYSNTRYFPQVQVEVSESKNKSSRSYTYNLGNAKESKGAFAAINIFTEAKLSEIKTPNSIWEFRNMYGQYYQAFDLTSNNEVAPGDYKTVVSFDGPKRAGIVPISFIQRRNFSTKKLSERFYILKADKSTPCPGFYQWGSSAVDDPKPKSIVIAPIPESQSSAISLIDNDGMWTGSVFQNENLVEISPLDEGTKEILILGSKDLKVKDIDLSSLKISRGKAKVKSSKIIKAHTVNNIDPLSRVKPEYDNLKISFDLQEANILCEIDHAILIQGKTKKGKKFLTGVRIKPVICDLKTFAKEIPKIRKELDAYKRDSK